MAAKAKQGATDTPIAEAGIPAPTKPKPRPKRRGKTAQSEFQGSVQKELAHDKAQRAKKPIGRPSEFTEERFQSILERIVCGESVRSICDDPGMPSRQTFFVWLYKMPDLVDRYVHAKHVSTYSDEDDLTDIADDGTNDWVEKRNKDGEVIGYAFNGEAAARSRLRVDTRRFLMERRMPQRFGAKVDVNHGVQPDNPLSSLIAAVSGRAIKPVEDPEE